MEKCEAVAPQSKRIVPRFVLSANPSVEQRHAIAECYARRGTIPRGPLVPLLANPRLFTKVRSLGDYLRFESPLPPRLRELTILMTLRNRPESFEWKAHAEHAIAAGLSVADVSAIRSGNAPTDLDDDECLACAFCAELLERGDVPDGVFEQLESRIGQRLLIDLVGLMGYYRLLGVVARVARLDQASSDAGGLRSSGERAPGDGLTPKRRTARVDDV